MLFDRKSAGAAHLSSPRDSTGLLAPLGSLRGATDYRFRGGTLRGSLPFTGLGHMSRVTGRLEI